MTVLSIYWCFILTMGLVLNITEGQAAANLHVYAAIRPLVILQAVGVIAVVVVVAALLWNIGGAFRWSWWNLAGKGKDNPEESPNINLLPFRIKYFGLFFGLLFLMNLPYLANIEEKIFREGTGDWFDGTLRSLAFGLVHSLLAGVPIAFGIAISFAGLAFTHFYFEGGISESTLYHTTYNLIIVSVILFGVVLKHFTESSEIEEQEAI
jgi:hypothetical protein